MGSHKHGVSGHPGKSPKLRLHERLQAERQENKARPSTTKWRGTVADLLKGDAAQPKKET